MHGLIHVLIVKVSVWLDDVTVIVYFIDRHEMVVPLHLNKQPICYRPL